MMKRAVLALLTTAAAAALLVPSQPAYPDDRDLLRFASGKPYLFILLDTSGSMNLEFGADDAPTVGHGDDPDSRIYAAKEALFEVFKNIDDVHFGFATYNQDGLTVPTRHWLYYVPSVPAGWPSSLGWPVADPDGLTLVGADGLPDNDVEGDAVVFGSLFPFVSDPRRGPNDGHPGSCADPLDLGNDEDRARLSAFAKLGADGKTATTIWIDTAGNRNNPLWIGLRFSPVEETGPDGASFVAAPGASVLRVNVQRIESDRCLVNNLNHVRVLDEAVFEFRLDPHLNDFLMIDRGVPGGGSGGNATEATAALWPFRDADGRSGCTARSPFSGKGWEGNYDSGVTSEQFLPPSDQTWTEEGKDVDQCDEGGGNCSPVALKPVEETIFSSFGRAMDRGDMLPFDWTDTNRAAFLQRLAPNWPDEDPDFGITDHLVQDPVSGRFQPRFPGRAPLIATGETPLGKALNDVRCWYMGDKGSGNGGKCRESAFFDAGWSEVACTFDSEYGCRKPFLIMITDGADTCAGENPGADVSDMKSFTGVQTWALNIGDPDNCRNGQLHSITNRAGGECVNVANKEELKQTLAEILGLIREQSRAFASAAVPSVQASADQALYISNFTPLNNKTVWDGHLNAFLKPLPLDEEGKPDITQTCTPDANGTFDGQSGCFLWDAGAVMRTDQVDASDPVGMSSSKRRVFFARQEAGDDLPQLRTFLELPENTCEDCDDNPTSSDCRLCFDVLRGLDLSFDPDSEFSLEVAEFRARRVIDFTLDEKIHTPRNPDGTVAGPDIRYVLGDIFHSNPIVVGTPVNVPYFARDVGSDGTDCEATDDGNPGYRCFLRRHRFRRKVILVGSNDGQLHAFNSGIADEVTVDGETEVRYDQGSGHELWSFIPRAVMPTLRELADSTATRQQFSVDGTPAVADAFVDPVHDGTPTAADRRWRTIVVGGLREGGSAYYALDITQPDTIGVGTGTGEFIPNATSESVAGCTAAANTTTNASTCGPLPYPALLWELTDSTADSVLTTPSLAPSPPVPMDEDGNGRADLGDTWSTPNIGRIRMCKEGGSACNPNAIDPADAADLRDVYVAIFGGGMDPDNKVAPQRGGFLYMVDVETGRILYKRRLLPPPSPFPGSGAASAGAAAMEPAAVDTDQDSYLDRIYVGTTGGFLYRVDLLPMSNGQLPELETVQARGIDGVTYDVERVPLENGGDPVWAPRVIFNANRDATSGSVVDTSHPRPLYHRPSVIFVANQGLFGLAFGTGDREDLWSLNDEPGRFYIFLDDTDLTAAAQGVDVFDLRPRDEGDLKQVGVFDDNLTEDLFVTRSLGQKGWFLALDADERVITNSFSLAGITVFSSFLPDVALTSATNCDPLDPNQNCPPITGTCGDKGFESSTGGLCAKTGASRLFVVGTTNANAFLEGVTAGTISRFSAINQFVTSPFTEPGQNPNDTSNQSGPSSDDLTQTEINVMNALMSLFPANCKFANYRIDVKTIAADTSVERLAAVPICIVQKNWKEF